MNLESGSNFAHHPLSVTGTMLYDLYDAGTVPYLLWVEVFSSYASLPPPAVHSKFSTCFSSDRITAIQQDGKKQSLDPISSH